MNNIHCNSMSKLCNDYGLILNAASMQYRVIQDETGHEV
jgi:hypothetical protein